MPAQAGIQSVQFRSFPINSCCFSFLDSHFCGNDGGRDKSSQSKASSFPQKTATRNTPSFPRRRESRSLNFGFFR
ncbi:hypothetical protein EWP70_11205 [Neisseria meningitidis]|nr:hypothetical protein [Neisseria meningitidis]